MSRADGSPRWAVVAVYAVPLGIAAALILSHLTSQPLWRDEVATVSIAGRGIGDMLHVIAAREFNGALYYVVLNPWIAIFGEGAAALRLPGVLFCLAGMGLAIHLSRTRWGLAAAVATGAVLASSAFLLYYAGEARGYALAAALGVLSTLLFMRAVEDGHGWGWWALASAAMVYAEVLAALLVVAQLGSLLFLRERPHGLVRGGAWLGLLVAPLAVITVGSGDKGQTDWAAKLKRVQLQDFGVTLAASRPVRVVLALIVLAAIVLLVRELARNGRSRAAWRLAVPVLWTVLPVVALALISVWKGLFVDRYLLFVVPGLAVTAGAVVAATPRVVLGVVLLACAALVVAHPPWERKRSEDLRAAAALVAARTQPGDGIAYSPAFARLGLDYYLERESRRPRDLDVASRAGGALFAGEQPPQVVARRLRAARRLWIVGYPGFPWHPTAEPVMAVAPAILRERFKLAEHRRFGELDVALYKRKS